MSVKVKIMLIKIILLLLTQCKKYVMFVAKVVINLIFNYNNIGLDIVELKPL